jgi:siroheme synthase
VALLERATLPDERVLKSTLADLPRLAHAAKLQSPTLLVIGEVAALAQVRGFIDLQEQSGAA